MLKQLESEVILLDFIPDKDFNIIFHRVSRKIDLKGAGTPAEINRRLKDKIYDYKALQKKRRLKPQVARRRISDLKKLIFRGFARRTIDEAVAHPQGKVALTLKYGRKEARKILLERGRKRIGTIRRRTSSRRRLR